MCETVQVEVEHQNKTRRERKRVGALAANVAKNILPTSSALLPKMFFFPTHIIWF